MATPEVAAAVAEVKDALDDERGALATASMALAAVTEDHDKTRAAVSRLIDLLAEQQPAPAPAVALRAVDTTSSTITVEWSTTGPDPAGWTPERDGFDTHGTPPWTRPDPLPGPERSFTFRSLRAGTEYTLTLTPTGGPAVSVKATTDPATTPGPGPQPGALHGPRALADGWVAAEIGRDDFTGPAIDAQWSLYNSAGHAGKGLRRPGQWSIVDDPAATDGRALRCVGTPDGTTGGMAMRLSQRFGRYGVRLRVPDGDPHYSGVALSWPTAENWPQGGEIDFREGRAGADKVDFFLHYSRSNQQTHGSVTVARGRYQWWEMEWTPDYVRGWCDGQQFFEDTNRAHFNNSDFQAHHLCLQLDWFPDGAARTSSAEMYVDAVRVYAHPASVRMRAPQALLGPGPYSSPVVDRFAKL